MKLNYFITPCKFNKLKMERLKCKNWSYKTPRRKQTVCSLTSILATSFWICLLRKGQQNKNRQDYMKLRSFCTAKETINKTKKQPTEWEKIFVNDTYNKIIISKT